VNPAATTPQGPLSPNLPESKAQHRFSSQEDERSFVFKRRDNFFKMLRRTSDVGRLLASTVRGRSSFRGRDSLSHKRLVIIFVFIKGGENKWLLGHLGPQIVNFLLNKPVNPVFCQINPTWVDAQGLSYFQHRPLLNNIKIK
jgi:hypothetical protein